MKLYLIAAAANNNVIGRDNKMLWHLPADLKRFKKLTMGHALIMGRKTFESIGKPLKGRENIVISTLPDYQAEGCTVVHSVQEALNKVKPEKEVFVIGGGEIYKQTIDLHQTRRLFITRVYGNFEGDAFFPEIDNDKWELTDIEEFEADNKNKLPYGFLIYKKKTSCK